jgi:hypothetical protein
VTGALNTDSRPEERVLLIAIDADPRVNDGEGFVVGKRTDEDAAVASCTSLCLNHYALHVPPSDVALYPRHIPHSAHCLAV